LRRTAIEADVMTVGFDWLLWLLVGALGGLLALLSAVAVANSYSGDPRVDRPLLQPELMHQDTSGASERRTDRTPPPGGDSETWDLAVAVEALIP
jgi:hypothetical protein